jgi:hypothetical protein
MLFAVVLVLATPFCTTGPFTYILDAKLQNVNYTFNVGDTLRFQNNDPYTNYSIQTCCGSAINLIVNLIRPPATSTLYGDACKCSPRTTTTL